MYWFRVSPNFGKALDENNFSANKLETKCREILEELQVGFPQLLSFAKMFKCSSL
jgi:hypothetical protein